MTECGLSNLAVCLPEKFIEYLLSIINAPLQILLNLAKSLMTEPVNISVFFSLWGVIVYILSMFYGLFIIFAGFNFMISGYDSAKRENAKSWLKNIIMMVLFVQASYILYGFVIELSALLSAGVMDIINPNFFLLTADNIVNVGLQFFLGMSYLIVIIIAIIFLALRYLLVAVGVVFCPIGVFCYFVPPLQGYGKMVLNVLAVVMFVPFFDAVILFASSALMSIPVFENFKIVIMTAAFLCINLFMIFLIIFAMLKAANAVMSSESIKTAVKVGKYLA
ncbi:MAG: hypothetical protein NT001_00750 [Candidatus Woesearchaeota archaeon]|nr:hypothetical protein [Candidatus Woesearchaeota archaeon]